MVERVWEPEQRHRRLVNPHPLPTAWVTVGPPVADYWGNIRADGLDEPLDLDGVVDLAHPDGLHRVLLDGRLRRRLVVLGDAGAGKTVLLIRLALSILEFRRHLPDAERIEGPHGDASGWVPVLLRLPTWNPESQTLQEWIASRLVADYGHRRPVSPNRLLPLLDGLDEMPREARARALVAIGAALGPSSPLVLTCRTSEYIDALIELREAGSRRPRFSNWPLCRLTPSEAISRTEVPEGPHDWRTVFGRDAVEHGGRLVAALNAPLWVDLARVTYLDPGRPDDDPAELLVLPDRQAVHGLLLDRLVPSVYPDPPEADARGGKWRRRDAHRWLARLAIEMRVRGTQDIAWWEFVDGVPQWVRFLEG
ncbi:hypothetical protein NKG94_50875 [Micromonospora sp. M12]